MPKNQLTGHFRTIQIKFSRLYARILNKTKLTLPQYSLLNELAVTGSATMTEISERLHISKPAVTHLADRLEQHRYLKRLSHPSDRRIHMLQILPKGEKITQDVQLIVINLLMRPLNSFSQEEIKSIANFYSKLSEVMDEVLEQPCKQKK